MSYGKTLSTMIASSHLSLREISERCKQNGVSVAPSYISKLQSGTQSPASDEINVAIANVCGGDPEHLIFEAYLERAPEVVQSLIDNLSTSMRNLWIALNAVGTSRDTLQAIHHRILEATPIELVREFSFNNDLLTDYQARIQDDHDQAWIEEEERRQDLLEAEVEAHLYFEQERRNQAFTQTVPMHDDSMQPTISQNAQVVFYKGADVSNGDIVLVELADQTQLIRRYILADSSVILIADNRKYPPLIVSLDEATVKAKAISLSVYL